MVYWLILVCLGGKINLQPQNYGARAKEGLSGVRQLEVRPFAIQYASTLQDLYVCLYSHRNDLPSQNGAHECKKSTSGWRELIKNVLARAPYLLAFNTHGSRHNAILLEFFEVWKRYNLTAAVMRTKAKHQCVLVVLGISSSFKIKSL